MIIVAVLWAAVLDLGAADRLYLVKRGDTLLGVARAYDVSVQSLAERNGLKPTALLLIGQKLRIPSSTSTSRTSESALPKDVQQAIASAHVKSGRWKRIVIHHSGTAEGTIKGMNAYHLNVRHMENGLAYHFVIGNGHGMGDGEIYVLRSETVGNLDCLYLIFHQNSTRNLSQSFINGRSASALNDL